MNFNVIGKAATFAWHRGGLLLAKHAPEILLGLGVGGFVSTVVMASVATTKLGDVTESAKKDFEAVKTKLKDDPNFKSDDAVRENAKIYGKAIVKIAQLYGPAVVVGTLSVGALTGSHVILKKRNVALAAAYKAVSDKYARYRENMEQHVGSDLETEAQSEVTPKAAEPKKKPEGKIGRKTPYSFWFDKTSTLQWQGDEMCNSFFLRTQESMANDKLASHGHLMLNEVLDGLGLKRRKYGWTVGWVRGNKNGDGYVSFGLDSANGPERVSERGEPRPWFLDMNVEGNIMDILDLEE